MAPLQLSTPVRAGLETRSYRLPTPVRAGLETRPYRLPTKTENEKTITEKINLVAFASRLEKSL
ncbi:hypothetical protein [Chroococcidiopsis sp. SAG 2025]|uniref:hypothetical protein n=1 Tax=Chroococcidiopsis sp. SAG 2025 TaxID=171389 RepID=UPI002936D75F|nr:hypothetical protein [Chroococcidiopsis sp. SAG 2025]